MESRWNLTSIFVLSIVLHVMTTLSLIGLSALFPAHADKTDITEVEFLTDPKQDKQFAQQIVRKAEIPEQEKDLNNEQDARFLSEQRQRVKREQQAMLSGKTQNSAMSATQAPRKPTLKELTQTSKDLSGFRKKLEIAPDGEMQNSQQDHSDFQKALTRKPPQLHQQQPSTIGEALPVDLAVGPMTALNTDRLTYYSFYERIEDLIRYRWESRIWKALESFDQNYLRTVISQRPWITHAEFLIKPDGKLVQALIMKPSGVQHFDLAAINAFKEAAIFPNPPKELIQSDGLIHLKYSFNVSYRR